MLSKEKITALQKFATQIRLETLKELTHLGFGHVGGAMSVVETLAVLYGEVMRIEPHNPRWEDRDWLVVSKGHSGPAVYAALALKGYFPVEELLTLNQGGTNLPSHCDRNKTVGVDMTTGSLGQGVSSAIGIALGNRLDKKDNYTYLIVGDGECDEGQVWEGALFAAHQKLDNLIAFVDYNKKQLDGYVKDINDLGDIGQKFASFDWHVQDVNGADVAQIYDAIQAAKEVKHHPSVIILDTIKGQGVPFVERIMMNHHIVVDQDQAKAAIADLEQCLAAYTI
ncbi:transketolase [candidate division KSB3 bacterium]|uniref:Transketolase n=1 Tax=candidate division KSB3 bacterium TaxID=2044937 RepID=A0A9D5JWA2_9BACT|nr:transketolase [candidate division KSB3 bacterium]MBD3325464.1 transketolase [candidate division KSB3 bacterium]